MAWWTHLLFFERDLKENKEELPANEGFSLASFGRAVRQFFYNNLVEILYVILSFFTYFYLLFSIVTFFFEKSVPPYFPRIIETLSEPYLGVLGIYVVVRELERRKGLIKKRTWGELFAVIWFFFFVAASFLTFFSEHYHLSTIYKTVVTNALAAVIIRVGILIR